jgi:demethylmenaquinone methyltransferase/2-methoxy-6-polyprenyl-1,4-benzoquinol methylase
MSKENFIHKLFDTITPGYDCFNRIASLGMDRAWRRRTINSLNLQPGIRVLDLASGTGDLAVESALKMLPLGSVIACDLSLPMLRSAARKWARHPVAGWHMRYAQARAEQLPFPEASFNAATIGFALRNVSDLEGTFRELHRVLRPGGRIALLEFGRLRNPLLRLGHWLWLTCAIPLLGLLFTGRLWPFLYLRRSILQFMPPEEVRQRLQTAGFSQVRAEPMTEGAVVLYQAVRG